MLQTHLEPGYQILSFAVTAGLPFVFLPFCSLTLSFGYAAFCMLNLLFKKTVSLKAILHSIILEL